MSDTAATMTLAFEKQAGVSEAGWKELVRGKPLSVADLEANPRARTPARIGVPLTLQPFEIAVVQGP
jgi:hypothetical protein